MNHLYVLRKAATETWLDETDPDWRERFPGDWQRAEEHYRRRPSRTIHTSAFEPPTFAKPDRDESDDGNFDTDLDGNANGQ